MWDLGVCKHGTTRVACMRACARGVHCQVCLGVLECKTVHIYTNGVYMVDFWLVDLEQTNLQRCEATPHGGLDPCEAPAFLLYAEGARSGTSRPTADSP